MSQHTNRIVEAARALLADPNNMDARTTYMRAVFNLDRTAAAIAELADRAEPPKEPAA